MLVRITDKETNLERGFDALLECHQSLEHCIAAEKRQPRPDTTALHLLGRERQRLKGELSRYDGLFRTLSRGRVQT